MADPTEIGARLKAVRTDRGFSLQKVAEVLKCHKTNVIHIEAGRHEPSVVQLRKLAALYDCLMEELIEGDLPLGVGQSPTPAPPEPVLPPHPFTGEDTIEMTRREIDAALARREARELLASMHRLNIPLTPEQRDALETKAGLATEGARP